MSNNKVIDIASALEFVNDYNNVGITGNNARITASGTGNLTIYATSTSANSSTGAIILQNGGLSINVTSLATSTTAGGGMTLAGGAAFGQNVYIGGGISGLSNTNTIGNIYTTNGNVGIGTINPSHRLDVSGTPINNSVEIQVHNPSFTTANLRLGVPNNAAVIITNGITGASVIANDYGPLQFGVGTTAGTATGRLLLDTSGNLGVGTSSPAFRLDVNGTVNAPTFTGANLAVTNSSIGNHNVVNATVASLSVSNQSVSNISVTSVTANNLWVTTSTSAANLRATNLVTSVVSTASLQLSGAGTVGALLVSGVVYRPASTPTRWAVSSRLVVMWVSPIRLPLLH